METKGNPSTQLLIRKGPPSVSYSGGRTRKSRWIPMAESSNLQNQLLLQWLSFPGGSEVKASAPNAGDLGSIPGLGRSPGEGNGNPLQYSCLENPMDGGAWWATVHGVTKSHTRLSDFTFHGGYKFCTGQVARDFAGPQSDQGTYSP